MIPGETVYSGAPTYCPDCEMKVPGPQVMSSPAGYYIGYGGCGCGPAYSRESGYFKTREAAESMLELDPSEYAR
jgi:hypothetical protein